MSDTPRDKFKAVWLSHSSIADFLKCPRLYYLRNVYKDVRTGHKMTVMTPPLALGQIVHETIESLSVIPVTERFSVSPITKFEESWLKIAGEIGGFRNPEQEEEYKERGRIMLQNLVNMPGPLLNKAIKLAASNGLSSYWFSEEDNLMLCGKVDWIEYMDSSDSIHIIDFKTGRREEEEGSLQLPIYLLLATNLQKRGIAKASYWYLNQTEGLKEMPIPDIDSSIDKIAKVGQRIKLARQLNHFVCPQGGCKHCYPLERVLKGEGKFVGLSEYKQDIYILN